MNPFNLLILALAFVGLFCVIWAVADTIWTILVIIFRLFVRRVNRHKVLLVTNKIGSPKLAVLHSGQYVRFWPLFNRIGFLPTTIDYTVDVRAKTKDGVQGVRTLRARHTLAEGFDLNDLQILEDEEVLGKALTEIALDETSKLTIFEISDQYFVNSANFDKMNQLFQSHHMRLDSMLYSSFVLSSSKSEITE